MQKSDRIIVGKILSVIADIENDSTGLTKHDIPDLKIKIGKLI
jgi:hypothetical protein